MGISVLTPRHRIGFRRTAVAVVVTLVAAIPASFSGSAAAAGPVSQATGDFLSGSVGGTDLAALIALQGASAQNFGVPAIVQEAKGLDVTAVSAINVSTGTVNLLGTNPILALGAANQYARANNDGSSFGASGAVTDTGAVSVGTGTQQGSATLDLTAILPVAGLLTSASVTVGALAATATETTAFAQSGNYQIAGLTVNAASPAVTALGTVLAALIAANCAAPPCPVTLTAPGVTLDLVAGTIALDLNTLIPGLDGGLPVGTALLPLLTAALATALATPVLTVNGVVVVVAPAVVAAALAAALTALVTALDTALTGVLALTVNNQGTVAGTFTETALRVNLLAAAVTIATVVNLASASVGPNAGPAPPTALTIDPNSGPTAGGQTVTITGANFIPGATTVTIGGNTVPATVDPSGASLTFITPAHAAVPVPVTVTTAGGTSTPPLTYTYVPPPTATSIDPNHGPETGGTTVTITGTGFVPGQTSVTIGGVIVPATAVTAATDGNSLTFATPPHAVGTVDVTVTTPGGVTTPPLAFTFEPAPPVITSPTDGSNTGSTPPITGTGTPGDTVTVTEGGTVLCTEVVAADGTWSCTPTSALSAGAHTITATQTAPTGEVSGPSAPVSFTVAELAATGAPVGRPLVIALVALLCGLTMVASARRRRGTQL